jgi:flavin reductase (DIM6/NTAB) family NADH-FMN oxidoreductase RutF
MKLEPIAIEQFSTRIFESWDKGWFLLTAGSFADKKFNCMTVSWGMMGTMWNKPIVQVVVRPSRYTFQFIEAAPDFTMCAFPEEQRKALSLLGSKSGRDGDKIAEAGITPIASSLVTAPCYAEANLVIECRKVFTDAYKPASFIDPDIEKNYGGSNYHHVYYGEVLAIRGE